ncbi:MAG: hypothetical protein ABJC51_05970 [Acidobacteriota bacterium]
MNGTPDSFFSCVAESAPVERLEAEVGVTVASASDDGDGAPAAERLDGEVGAALQAAVIRQTTSNPYRMWFSLGRISATETRLIV